jgi:streptogramin lyase
VNLSPSRRHAQSFELERVATSAELAEQLPANYWYALVLDQLEDAADRAELKQQCTYCHQQGNWATRRERTREEWEKLILLMGRRGAMLSRGLREKLPDAFVAAYARQNALPKLMAAGGSLAPATAEARRAVIEEWDLGGRASTQHDVMVHPDGRIYSVDGPQDLLHRLDPSVPGGKRSSWNVPRGDLPPGGVFATPETSTSNSHVGPHSLQTAPDGSIWITLALGNQLARFDVESETWTIHEVAEGIYPHTLRFDARGRIWYTMAATNHVGMFDPATGEQRHLRLPARTWTQALILRAMPVLLRIGRRIDIRGPAAEGDGIMMPVPYGIDIAPDGGVWFSQLNERRIGRIDPESLALEMIDTPFETPRRLRFDSQGGLWIPSFSESLLAHFDLGTRVFRSWRLPVEPFGSETPYALAIDRRSDEVWICGTNSDTMLRFEPDHERFTVYPLPTRVTYTREVDFDAQGRVWTSNSNGPTWQIEGGTPKVVRIDPRGAPAASASPLFGNAENRMARVD